MTVVNSKKGTTIKQIMAALAVVGCLTVMVKVGFKLEAGLRIVEQEAIAANSESVRRYGNNLKTIKNYSLWIDASGASKVVLEQKPK